MRKTRLPACICLLVILLPVLLGCSRVCDMENEEYTVLDVAMLYDCGCNVPRTAEVPDWSRERMLVHGVSDAEKELSVHFGGQTYSGTYTSSSIQIPKTYRSHHYKGEGVSFSVSEEGELTGLAFTHTVSSIQTVTEEECRRIADAIAEDYIDLDAYLVDVSTRAHYSNTIYTFVYDRRISGYETSDRLSVTVDGNGRVCSFTKMNVGSFDRVKEVKINTERALAAIDKKMAEIYQNDSSYQGYDVESVMLVMLSDKRCALLYTLNGHHGSTHGEYVHKHDCPVHLILTV